MSYSTKLFLIPLVCFFLGAGINVLAQEEQIIEEVILDETVSAEDLETKEPNILPDSRFYFLKEWQRNFQSLLTFDKIKKTELESKFSSERLLEIRKMINENKDPEVIKNLVDKYKETIDKTKKYSDKIKENGSKNPKVDKFLEKYAEQQILHQRILEKLEQTVPPEVYEKIKEARERHLEKFKDVMLKLEEKNKIGERLKNILEKRDGSDFKDFKTLELLERLKEKMPEDAKAVILKTEEDIFEKLKNKTEGMSKEQQERLKTYLEQTLGDKEKKLEIINNLKIRLKAPLLKDEINRIQEKIKEKIKEKECETDSDCPAPDCAPTDDCSDITAKCIREKCINIEKEKPEACIDLWDPVCAKNGKTYSNECFAKIAGVEITHKGGCEKEKDNLINLKKIRQKIR